MTASLLCVDCSWSMAGACFFRVWDLAGLCCLCLHDLWEMGLIVYSLSFSHPSRDYQSCWRAKSLKICRRPISSSRTWSKRCVGVKNNFSCFYWVKWMNLTQLSFFAPPQDEVRTQKATKQKNTLEAVNNSVKLLNEMLAHFNPEESTDGDKELIRVCCQPQITFWTKFTLIFENLLKLLIILYNHYFKTLLKQPHSCKLHRFNPLKSYFIF